MEPTHFYEMNPFTIIRFRASMLYFAKASTLMKLDGIHTRRMGKEDPSFFAFYDFEAACGDMVISNRKTAVFEQHGSRRVCPPRQELAVDGELDNEMKEAGDQREEGPGWELWRQSLIGGLRHKELIEKKTAEDNVARR